MSIHHEGTFFSYVKELLDTDTITLDPYTDNHYTKLVYNILNKTDQYRIGIREWDKKDTSKNTLAIFKPHFRNDHE